MGAKARKKTSTTRIKAKVGKPHRTSAKSRRTKAPARASGHLNWDARYGDLEHWKKTCAIAHKATGGVCCCCLKRKSEEVHHSRYGCDRVGYTVFPLCKKCHTSKAHSPKNWRKDKADPVWGNRNSKEFEERLKLGFKLLSLRKS